MKKLLFILLLGITINTQATHTFGGTIYWECKANGQHQFFLEFYRSCSGIPWSFFGNNQIIEIFGAPFPTDAAGNPINFITIEPDSITYVENRNGDTSPVCNADFGDPLECPNESTISAHGLVQVFYYKSELITLQGVPPNEGWHFRWESACCRPGGLNNVDFAGVGGPVILRASMFPSKDKKDINPCFDSSPKFVALPYSVVCRGLDFSYNAAATDNDIDSLVHSWGHAVTTPIEDIPAIPYLTGYSKDNPTPDQSFDSSNVPAKLDSASGLLNLKVVSGVGIQTYLIATKAESYRNGVKSAAVFREYPILVTNCDPLNEDALNNAPQVIINAKRRTNYTINVAAGDKVSIPIQVIDNDIMGAPFNSTFQEVSVEPVGQQFSDNFKDDKLCDLPPCATIKNSTLAFDTLLNRYIMRGAPSSSSILEWQTTCDHLTGNDGESNSYFFYFNSQDDLCPHPARTDAVIEVKIHPRSFRKAETLCIGKKEAATSLNVQWTHELVDSSTFRKWLVYRSEELQGNYQLIDSISEFDTTIYRDFSANIGKQNHYYIRYRTTICGQEFLGARSDTISTIKLSIDPSQTAYPRVLWNEQKTIYGLGDLRSYQINRSSPPGSGFIFNGRVTSQEFHDDIRENCNQDAEYYLQTGSRSCFHISDTVLYESRNHSIINEISELNRVLSTNASFGAFQWYDCNAGRFVFDSTRRSFAPQDTGNFAVIVTQNGCRDTSECIRIFPVGIEESAFRTSVHYYPNPTTGQFIIELGEEEKQIQVLIRNIHGQLLKESRYQNLQRLELNIEGKAGIRYIQLIIGEKEQLNFKVLRH